MPLVGLTILKGALANWKLVGVGLLALALGVQTLRVGSLKRGEIACQAQVKTYQAVEAAARAKAAQVAKTQAQVTKAATQAYTVTAGHIQTITRTIVKNVPTYITPATDTRYPLPVGFVRVSDAAALGLDVSAIPLPAGQSDDSPSTVTASHAATIIAGNYGGCRANAAQLAALEGWVTQEGLASK